MLIARQLGNGTAFQTEQTNTSFTVFDDRILVDCGYNVFGKLKELGIADKIELVCITHTHDDHIGSLGAFLYYREFVLKKPIVVIGNDVVNKYLTLVLQGREKAKYPTGFKPLEYVRFQPSGYAFEYYNPMSEGYKLVIETKDLDSHSLNPDFPTTMYAFYIYKAQSKKLTEEERTLGDVLGYSFVKSVAFRPYVKVVVTGDTKANPDIEKFAFKAFKYEKGEHSARLLVFHDYSKFSSVLNPHANAKDFEEIYSSEFKQYVVKVHTGDESYKKEYRYEDLKTCVFKPEPQTTYRAFGVNLNKI